MTNGSANTVVEYAHEQLATGSPVPVVTISSNASRSLDGPAGLAFDASGDLWVTNGSANTVVEYAHEQLATGSPVPVVTISSNASRSLDGPAGLAFDASGDLWVTNGSANTVVEYAHEQLATGSPVPVVTISSNASRSLDGPAGLAFDASGDLWVTNGSANTVVEYAHGQLATGSTAPRATLLPHPTTLGSPSSLSLPRDLVFTHSGDLWVTNEAGNDLVEYGPSQLVNGSPAPLATVYSGSSGDLSVPLGLGFNSAGDLWVANEQSNDLVEYTPAQLVGGSPTPNASISSPSSLDWPYGVTFDRAGDLWVANYTGDSVVEYAASQLATRSPIPIVTIGPDAAGSINGPDALAFDRSGDLWVANYDANTDVSSLVEYTPSQLATGSAAPIVTISPGPSGSLDEPDGLAFDSAGDLWVVNYSANTLVEYAPSQLATGAPTPIVTISSGPSASLNEPDGLACDSAGDLWVANYNSSTVVEYKLRQLSTGSPAPAMTISPGPSASLDAPDALAFDSSGDLWVANYNSNTVVEYRAGQLDNRIPPASAMITPEPGGMLDGPDGLVFDPSGDLWVVNFNNNTVVEYATT